MSEVIRKPPRLPALLLYREAMKDRSFWQICPKLRSLPALLLYREAMKEQGKRNDFNNNVMEVGVEVQGNSRAYSLDRVVRECEPEQPEKPTTKNTEKPYRY